MTVLLLKLTLSPMIIAAASLLTRRFGPVVGGWLIGLPVTAGPVALFLALDHGASFAARVSTGFVAGVSGQAAFVLGYVALARRGAPWLTALLAGTACFAITGVALVEAGLSLPVLLACALAILIVGLRLLPPAAVVEQPPAARRDVVLRMVAATFFVLAITTFATQLGPGLSGVATTFPLLSTILAVSMHRSSPGAAIAVYRGLMTGLFALTAFAATLAVVLPRLPVSEAFALAIALTLSIQLGSFKTLRRGAGAPRMTEIVFVEIPGGSRNKYEWDDEAGGIVLDRRLFTSMSYPSDYGFIEGTFAEDGDPLDALVLVSDPTFPGCRIRVRPIGVFHMSDEKGPDEKVICVPLNDPTWGRLADIHDVPSGLRDEIEHFFQVYKDLDHSGSVITNGFGNRTEAEQTIAAARKRTQ